MKQHLISVGDIFTTNMCGDVKITEIENRLKVHVTFLNTGFSRVCTSYDLRKGLLKDPYHPAVKGVGYTGAGVHGTRGTDTKKYAAWNGMIDRCYGVRPLFKIYREKGIRVCEEWHNYQNFGDWFDLNYKGRGFDLDKDILNPDSKLYSPDTCEYVPHSVNMLVANIREGTLGYTTKKLGDGTVKYIVKIQHKDIGYVGSFDSKEEAHAAYVVAKKSHVLRVANHYYQINEISKRIYETLCQIQVL